MAAEKNSDYCDNDVTMLENQATKSKKNNKLCPLFMEGLPSDFSTNPALAAIASLLDEGECNDVALKEKEYKVPSARAGGGKVRRSPARSRRKEGRPYGDTKHKDDKPVSVGEANLFLKMWKL
jgi:hypothetical protein